MRKKWWIGILVPLSAIFIAAGCGNQADEDNKSNNTEKSSETTAEADIPKSYQSCASCHGGNLAKVVLVPPSIKSVQNFPKKRSPILLKMVLEACPLRKMFPMRIGIAYPNGLPNKNKSIQGPLINRDDRGIVGMRIPFPNYT